MTTYGYDVDNKLTTSSTGASLTYDPTGRLYQVTSSGGTVTRYTYDGPRLSAAYDSSGTLLRRFVHGPGVDEPVVWYEGSGTTDRRWLVADNQGSTVAVTNSSGAVTNLNTYDEYGVPGASNAGLFQYTGQIWIAEFGLYHYKARVYSPTLGRFLQTDPIGMKDDLDLYAYVGNDPVNASDPTGLIEIPMGTRLEVTLEAYPGPEATDNMAEHGPDHIHLQERGARGDVKISTETWTPLKNERALTRAESKFLKKLSDEWKAYIKSAQKDIFKRGEIAQKTNEMGISASIQSGRRRTEEARSTEAGKRGEASTPEIVKTVIKGAKSTNEED